MFIGSKKIFITIVIGISLSFAFSSFKPAQTFLNRIGFLISNWDNIVSETNFDYGNIHSWLPESGIRGRYEITKSVLSMHTLSGIIGEPVFVSGPHVSEVNFDSNKEFGYYNPEFINKTKNMLATFYRRQNFVTRRQSFYDTHFKNYLRVFYMAYKVGYNNQTVVDGYTATLSSSNGYPSDFLQESFRDFAESVEKQGYDVYEGFTCPGFWVRRTIDGTGDEFYDLLVLTLQTFDPEFLKK